MLLKTLRAFSVLTDVAGARVDERVVLVGLDGAHEGVGDARPRC